MPDSRRHRGPHPADAELFDSDRRDDLRTACSDLSWLLSRGYAERAALALVGDRHRLRKRQRQAVLRAACSDQALAAREQRRLGPGALNGARVAVDAFNCLITVEAGLGGAPLFRGRDGCVRDLASVHGSYRRVAETEASIERLAAALGRLQVADVTWFLDKPVSNSGRVAAALRERAAVVGAAWQVRVVFAPDREVAAADAIACSTDSWILDHCRGWFDLAGFTLAYEGLPVLDLGGTLQP